MRQPGPRETNGGAEMGCAKANKPLHLSFRPLDAQRQEAFLLSAKEGKKREKTLEEVKVFNPFIRSICRCQ